VAHYAYIDENNIVIQVIVGRDEDDLEPGINSWEEYFTAKEENVRVLQTSYNTRGGVHVNGGEPLRKNYAGIGMTYDEAKDAFIPQRPFPSWTLNEETCLWDPPVQPPSDNTGPYEWDEETGTWLSPGG
jgi:hypothetical protein